MRQRRRSYRSMVALVGAALMFAGCGSSGSSTLAGITRPEPLQVGSVSLPDVTDGSASSDLTMAAEPGHLLITYFGYTHCPDVCPTTMFDLANALERIGDRADRVDVALVTVDPDRDTPEVLNGYLDYFFDGRYHAVQPVDLEQLADAQQAFGASSSVMTTASGEIEVSHTAITYVIDQAGSVLVEWPFGTKGETMADDLEILLARQEETS
ncbi:MAG: SCO family protein [Acidimicrobiia bacterium]